MSAHSCFLSLLIQSGLELMYYFLIPSGAWNDAFGVMQLECAFTLSSLLSSIFVIRAESRRVQ